MTSVLNAVKGAVIAIASSLVIAILFAYLFRLPIPMGGMIGPFGAFSSYGVSPIEVLQMVFMAWVFYGLFGGLIILVVCGAITGIIIGNKYSGSKNNKNKIDRLMVSHDKFNTSFLSFDSRFHNWSVVKIAKNSLGLMSRLYLTLRSSGTAQKRAAP